MSKLKFILWSLFLLGLTFPIHIGNAQSISKLDQNNGFKKFNFGDSYYKWSENICYNPKRPDCIPPFRPPRKAKIEVTYNYNGQCCKTIFGERVLAIGLGFTENKKLGFIGVSLYDLKCWGVKLTKEYVDNFINTIEKSFGNPTTKDKYDYYVWEGNKVKLKVSVAGFSDADKMFNKEGVSISIIDKDIIYQPSSDPSEDF